MEKKYIGSFNDFFHYDKMATFFRNDNRLTSSLNRRIFNGRGPIEKTTIYGENITEIMGVGDGVFVRAVTTLEDNGKPNNVYFEAYINDGLRSFITILSAQEVSVAGKDSVTKVVYTDSVSLSKGREIQPNDYEIKETGGVVFDNVAQQSLVTAYSRIKSQPQASNSLVSSTITAEDGLTEIVLNPFMPNETIPQTIAGVLAFRDELINMPYSMKNYHYLGEEKPLSQLQYRPQFDARNFTCSECLEQGDRVSHPSQIAKEFINGDSIAAYSTPEEN